MSLPVENVQDYPRPPALEIVPQHLSAWFADTQIVATNRAYRVLETHHAPTYYIPLSDVSEGVLQPVPGRSFCEWKGMASYFDLVLAGRRMRKAAWTYSSPTAKFSALVDHVAIYAHALDRAFVGEELVTPQPGDFYGGWVTSNLKGIVKGGPGTEGW
ncbi:MAG: DUF427 domain-containing protein [Pseudomonadota bacterium]